VFLAKVGLGVYAVRRLAPSLCPLPERFVSTRRLPAGAASALAVLAGFWPLLSYTAAYSLVQHLLGCVCACVRVCVCVCVCDGACVVSCCVRCVSCATSDEWWRRAKSYLGGCGRNWRLCAAKFGVRVLHSLLEEIGLRYPLPRSHP
jgi:hypothetical protein